MDWIEFEGDEYRKILFRPEYVIGLRQIGFGNNKCTVLTYEEGNKAVEYGVSEPYEQVKQKIMDAEKVDLSDVVVEHFTKEEYEKLLSAVQIQVDNCTIGHLTAQVNKWRKLENKLNEILKEAR